MSTYLYEEELWSLPPALLTGTDWSKARCSLTQPVALWQLPRVPAREQRSQTHSHGDL